MAKFMEQELDPLASDLQQSLDVATVELDYVKSQHQVASILADERERQLRVRVLLLGNKNDDLHTQLAQDDDRIDETERYTQNLRAQLDHAEGNAERLVADLRMKFREVDTLKAELDSLSGVTMDSTKLLTEKLALARELSSLKPEIDHLRSLATAQQGILAERLSLQRQLNIAQVELETEKRATQRVLAKENRLLAEDSKLEQRIESLQAELIKERRERQKAEYEAQRASAEWEGRKMVLESRLDAFKTKLRMMKEQLKLVEGDRQNVPAASQNLTNHASRRTALTTDVGKNSRKRNAAQMENDSTIGTPGVLSARKRGARLSTMPGDKSTFSITPFLNRTTSLAPEGSPERENDNVNGARDVSCLPQSVAGSDAVPPKSPDNPAKMDIRLNKPKTSAGGTGVPLPNKVGKSNAKAPRLRKAKAALALEQVAEEDNDDSATNPETRGAELHTEFPTDTSMINGLDVRKKKRKLLGGGLGKTLFDEDDPESTNGSQRGILCGARSFGSLGKVASGGLKGNIRTDPIASIGGFGTISPLKRDKKAVPC